MQEARDLRVAGRKDHRQCGYRQDHQRAPRQQDAADDQRCGDDEDAGVVHAVPGEHDVRGSRQNYRRQQAARDPEVAEACPGDQRADAREDNGQNDREGGLAEEKVGEHRGAQRQDHHKGDDIKNARERVALGVIGITRTGQELLDPH